VASSSPSVAVLGYVAASLTTLSFIPQALKTLRSGDTSAISLRMYVLFTAGIALWGIYGLLTADGPLIAANAITLVSAGLILERKARAVLSGRAGRPRGGPS
jgi:MtN3 and saliva related transmembrane protein